MVVGRGYGNDSSSVLVNFHVFRDGCSNREFGRVNGLFGEQTEEVKKV